MNKLLNKSIRDSLIPGLLFLLALSWSSAAQARTITVSLDYGRLKYSTIDPNYQGQTYYTVNVSVNSDIPPVTYDEVISPTSDFSASESGSSRGFFTDFSSALNAMTNGPWKLTVNKGDASEKQYTFTVTASGLSNNNFPSVQITTPADGSPAVSTNTPFSWSGPAAWNELFLRNHTPDYSFDAYDFPSPDTTSWSTAPPMPLGTNEFEVTYWTNAAPWFTISTPVDNLTHPFTNWVGGSKLFVFTQSVFVTSTNPAAPAGGHTLIAHYAFDDSGNEGLDSTGNGNDINCSSGWGPGHVFTTDAVAGGGALQFFSGSSITPCGQAFTSWTNALAGSFSVSAWIKTTTVVGGGGDDLTDGNGQSIIYADNNNLGATPIALTGTKVAFRTTDPDGHDDTLHSIQSVTTGNYVHILSTRNQITGEKKIYINGMLDSSDFASTEYLSGAQYVSIGGELFSAYAGLVDDVQIYKGVLSGSDVDYLYNHPGSNVLDTTSQDFNDALSTTGLTWTTGGDTDWFVQITNTHDNVSAARSGIVTNDTQISYLETTVIGPGTLSFWWQTTVDVLDTSFDFDLEFDIDGGYYDDILRNTPWTQDTFHLDSGQHTLRWTAFAFGNIPDTDAGYLDEVSYVPDNTIPPPVITLNPFDQTNYPGYNVALLAAATTANTNTVITWQWFKIGGASPIPNATNALFIPTNSGTAAVAGSYYGVASTLSGPANTTTATVSFASAPLPPDWARALKSPFAPVDATVFTKDYYLGCAVDAAGDIYTAAQYFGNMDVLTNGNTANVLTAPGGYAAALVKHAVNGDPLWAVGLTNNQTGSSYGIAVTVAPGNGAYLAASCSGTNWLGTNKFVAVGNSILLSRFDANGSNVWSKLVGGTNGVYTSYHLVVADALGNVTLAGNMFGTADFGGTNLSAPSGAGFMAQYDATGVIRWAQTVPDFIYYLAYDSGLLYVSLQSSESSGVTNASIGSLSNLTDRAWAVACVNNSNGQALWLRGVGNQYGANTIGLIDDFPYIAASGSNVFLAGNAYGSATTFGGLSVPLTGTRGQYLARYDTNGNAQVAIGFGSPTTTLWALDANASSVYVGGDFDSYSRFGSEIIATPVVGQNDLGPLYFTQPFVAKFDNSGNPLWARNGVSSDFANFRGIATTSDSVWAAGFLKISNSVPAQFGTNSVYSDIQIIPGVPFSTTVWNQGGMLAKITDNPTAVALPVTLLNPQDNGTSFQFQFLSQAGFTHAVQYKTNLALGNWQTYSNVTGDGALKTIPVPLSIFSPARQGFIRVQTQ